MSADDSAALQPLIEELAQLSVRVEAMPAQACAAAIEAVRALVAESLLKIEQRCASLRDGVDGVGIAALVQSADLTTLTIEFTSGEEARIELPQPKRGEPGERGLIGIGLDATAWARGVYRKDAIVQHHLGRTYRALEDTADEPGDSAAWVRVGLQGLRWCGPFDAQRTYVPGDIYANGGSFIVLEDGSTHALSKKPLTPSDVRGIAERACEPMQRELARLESQARTSELAARAAAHTLETLLSALRESVFQELQRMSARVAELEAHHVE